VVATSSGVTATRAESPAANGSATRASWRAGHLQRGRPTARAVGGLHRRRHIQAALAARGDSDRAAQDADRRSPEARDLGDERGRYRWSPGDRPAAVQRRPHSCLLSSSNQAGGRCATFHRSCAPPLAANNLYLSSQLYCDLGCEFLTRLLNIL
jgi:hypothetical protein